MRRVEPVKVREGEVECAVSASPGSLAAQAPGGGEPDVLGFDQITPVAPQPQEHSEAPCELNGLNVEAGFGGLAGHVHQDCVLGVKPGQGLLPGSESLWGDARLRRRTRFRPGSLSLQR
jgi:hypothetical protein